MLFSRVEVSFMLAPDPDSNLARVIGGAERLRLRDEKDFFMKLEGEIIILDSSKVVVGGGGGSLTNSGSVSKA